MQRIFFFEKKVKGCIKKYKPRKYKQAIYKASKKAKVYKPGKKKNHLASANLHLVIVAVK